MVKNFRSVLANLFGILATIGTVAAAEPTAEEIEAAFASAKETHAETIKQLTKLGVARKLTEEKRQELRKLRETSTVTPTLNYKLGSIGTLNASFRGADGSNSVSNISIPRTTFAVQGNRVTPSYTSTPAILEHFDNSKLTPGDRLSLTVYLDRFDGTTAIYRPLDLAPYAAKFGKVK